MRFSYVLVAVGMILGVGLSYLALMPGSPLAVNAQEDTAPDDVGPGSAVQPKGAGKSYGKRYAYVSKVNVHADGYLYICVKGNFTRDHGSDKRWYAKSAKPLEHGATRAQLQVATASYLAQKPVFVSTLGEPGRYLTLQNLQLHNE